MKKLVALDLDDTILNSDDEVSRATVDKIHELIEAGIKVSIITGRNYFSSKEIVERLKIQCLSGFINGAAIWNPQTGEYIQKITIEKEPCQHLIEAALNDGLECLFFTEDHVYCHKETQFTAFYTKLTDEKLHCVEDWNQCIEKHLPEKLIILGPQEKLKHFKASFGTQNSKNIHLVFSKPEFLEAFNINVSKGHALEWISSYYGIDPKDIIAFGDGETDIAMLKFAGLGVAMGNAKQIVKAAADVVTKSNDEDGVLTGIEKWL